LLLTNKEDFKDGFKDMSTKFNVGDEVQCVSDPSRIGTVVEICEVHAGIQPRFRKCHSHVMIQGATFVAKICTLRTQGLCEQQIKGQ